VKEEDIILDKFFEDKSNPRRIDPKELDLLLEEMIIMHSRAELTFLKKQN